ncbi:iron-hydroxamate ABC transporter substrate-binding protein [Lentibacillus sp. CBA3610]|uniref:iron-hydroxamate ABC transporter substrate-binding protein n=1 Tax=Lentibacillus sp. CBA3610 TaxID=2518176 RepID=UPI0015959326|nr:iron-hydroxamate ABC transporter substrate-binding protein [Lentibacillus sp. CBA3610]QKY68559.1 iron-hydroxamate ABC transporter substrate-binding protein [Lentibacillus sp. CBA3610]
MRKLNRPYSLVITLLIALILLMTACGGSDSDEESSSGEQAGSQDSDVTLDSEMGEVTIPADTERIIAPYHEDALLALGVTPTAKWAIGETVQDYLADDLQDVPKIEWNLPLEQVLNHEPDLIILENAIDSYEGSYEDYQKIATTYVMTEETTNNWRKQIETFGEMLGKEAKAEEVLNQFDEKTANAKETLNNAIGEETVALIWAQGDQFYLFENNRHSAKVLYSQLGINQPELVSELGEAKPQWNPISLEKLSELKADHVFLLAQENEQGLETLEDSSVWQNTPAAQNGNVYTMNDPSHWTNKGLIAFEKTIDDVLETLTE